MQVFIKENSWIARLAAFKLRKASCAIVIGQTIYLHRASKEAFLSDMSWLRHEVCHVRQWKKQGFVFFLFHYLILSLRYGYHQNPYEVEARKAEGDTAILKGIWLT